MKRAMLLILAISILISCTQESTRGRTIVISVASDYSSFPAASNLYNTLNDQAAFLMQVMAMDENAEIHMFRTEGLRSYYSTAPVFESSLESIYSSFLADSGNVIRKKVDRIPFLPELGNTSEIDWTIYDVARLLASIETRKEDLLIFHYSGHGDVDGSLVHGEHDGELMKVKPAEIMHYLSDEYRQGIKLLILDSCYSGTFVGETEISSGITIDEDEYKLTSPLTSFLSSFSQEGSSSSFYALTASSASQLSYDSYNFGKEEEKHFGVFSYHLLSALGFDFKSMRGRRAKRITLYGLYKDIFDSFNKEMLVKETPRVTLNKEDIVLFD